MCFIAKEVKNSPELPHEDSCQIRFEIWVFHMTGVEYLFIFKAGSSQEFIKKVREKWENTLSATRYVPQPVFQWMNAPVPEC